VDEPDEEVALNGSALIEDWFVGLTVLCGLLLGCFKDAVVVTLMDMAVPGKREKKPDEDEDDDATEGIVVREACDTGEPTRDDGIDEVVEVVDMPER
jgi:hypothetical protein